ncbi:MAG: GH25 family lysozyme [Kofleriaceae bacterium]
MYGLDLLPSLQAPVDWLRVQASGRTFAYVRAANGCTIEAAFSSEWRAMEDARITRGAWQSLRADEDAAEQALRFLKAVELQRGDLPPMLDLEHLAHLSAATIAAMIATWVSVVEPELEARHGVVLRAVLRATSVSWPADQTAHEVDRYGLWIVDPFNFTTPLTPRARHPDDWTFHQYTLGTRGIPGAAGVVRLDRFHPSAVGDEGPHIERWKQLLRRGRFGDISDSPLFDVEMRDAVVRLQARRGLVADGVVDPRTCAELHWLRP